MTPDPSAHARLAASWARGVSVRRLLGAAADALTWALRWRQRRMAARIREVYREARGDGHVWLGGRCQRCGLEALPGDGACVPSEPPRG